MVAETDWLLELPGRYDHVLGVVGRLDLRSAEIGDRKWSRGTESASSSGNSLKRRIAGSRCARKGFTGRVTRAAIRSGNNGIAVWRIDVEHAAAIVAAASGKEYAAGPGSRIRAPARSSRNTACAATSPTSSAEIVGTRRRPPPGTTIRLLRIIRKNSAMENAAPRMVQFSSKRETARSTSSLILPAANPNRSISSGRGSYAERITTRASSQRCARSRSTASCSISRSRRIVCGANADRATTTLLHDAASS